MFRKLFGETDEEQLAYLQKKVIITAVCAVLDIAVLIFAQGILFLPLCGYYWGWGFIRAYFGITTFGAIFSRNVVVGALIIGVFLVLGGIVGAVTMALGVGRYIFLKVKYAKAAQ